MAAANGVRTSETHSIGAVIGYQIGRRGQRAEAPDAGCGRQGPEQAGCCTRRRCRPWAAASGVDETMIMTADKVGGSMRWGASRPRPATAEGNETSRSMRVVQAEAGDDKQHSA